MILLKENKKHQENQKIQQNATLKYIYSHFIIISLIIFYNIYLQRELERLRKESSTLLAKERARVNELLRQQENEKEMFGSFKLKVKWKKNNELYIYDKNNLKSLFSKVLKFYCHFIFMYIINCC